MGGKPRGADRPALIKKAFKRQWRDYETEGGNRPVRDFMAKLTSDDRAEVVAAMKDVAVAGVKATARHLKGDIYEVYADGQDQDYRVLFATEGHYSHVFLALEAFSKKTQKTPAAKIEIAEERLKDWRRRGAKSKQNQ